MSRPWKVGLTGGIGCGKSVVASIFSRLGVPIIDADIISRELTATPGPVLQQLIDAFGPRILNGDGLLDRPALRDIIFADTGARHTLETILHPLVYARMKDIYNQLQSAYCIFSIPLLLETDASGKVDRILVVDCSVQLQIERTRNRDKVARQIVENIIRSQISRESRLAAADDVIVNNGSILDLEPKVNELHVSYLELSLNRS